MKYLCVGEVVIDFTSTGDLAFQGHPGGSSLNVAVAVARLGGEVGFAGQMSTDMFGERVLEHLAANHVNTTFVERSDAPSTLGFVTERDGDAEFSFMANGAADTLYDPRPRPGFPAEVSYLQFGSIGLLHEPASTTITELVAEHREQCTIVFDPNVRPALITDQARYLEQFSDWLALADVVKLSARDLGWVHPDRAEAAAGEWLKQGPRSVIVTEGADGARWFRVGHQPVAVPGLPVTVVDTVGAGDAFTGAVMVALAERSAGDGSALSDTEAEAVMRRGVAAATLNCTRSGADPPKRNELDAFLAELSASSS